MAAASLGRPRQVLRGLAGPRRDNGQARPQDSRPLEARLLHDRFLRSSCTYTSYLSTLTRLLLLLPSPPAALFLLSPPFLFFISACPLRFLCRGFPTFLCRRMLSYAAAGISAENCALHFTCGLLPLLLCCRRRWLFSLIHVEVAKFRRSPPRLYARTRRGKFVLAWSCMEISARRFISKSELASFPARWLYCNLIMIGSS